MTEQRAVHEHGVQVSEDAAHEAAVELAAKIDISSTTAIASFGRDFKSLNADYADVMIKELASLDSDELHKKLAEVVVTARSFSISPMHSRLDSIPILGRITSGLRTERHKLMTRFSSLERQIDQVLSGIDSSFERLSRQCATLETMYDGVKEELQSLAIYKQACEIRLSQLKQEAVSGEQTDEERTRDRALIENALEKRIADLAVLKHSAAQTLPMIRLMASNSSALIDKFHNIKTLTVPSWKRSFAMALSLQEQRKAVSLADTIDDATNYFLARNAELLRENTVATIKSNQRLAIDVETLEHVHATVIATFEDAQACFRESRESRTQVMEKLETLSGQLSRDTTLISHSNN